MNISYIESPKQLSESLEYNSINQKKCFYILRDNGNDFQLRQYKNEISRQEDFEYCIIKALPENKVQLLKVLLFVFFKVYRFYRSEEIVVGDARSIISKFCIFCARLFLKKIVFVDDGLYLLNHIKKLSGVSCLFYTDLPVEHLLADNQEVWRKENESIEMLVSSNCAFIGMKLVEIDYMDFDVYLDNLEDLINNNEGEFIYYAHREESELKLNSIKELGYTVIRPELTLENHLIENGSIAVKYYSFYSTALYSLSRMIDKGQFIALKPDIKSWPVGSRNAISDCYELFNLAGIQAQEV